MRNSLKNVSYKAHKSITNDLKIYIIGKYSSSLHIITKKKSYIYTNNALEECCKQLYGIIR